MSRNEDVSSTPFPDMQDAQAFPDGETLLRTRLQGLQTHFLADGTNFLKDAYGVTEAISPARASFLAYAELHDEYTQLLEAQAGTNADRTTLYETQKAQMKSSRTKGLTAKLRKLSEQYRERAASGRQEYTQLQAEQAYLLGLTVRDVLSPAAENEDTPHLFSLWQESEKDLAERSSSPFHQKRAPLTGLLRGMGSFLAETTDPDLFSDYAYRMSPDLLKRGEDLRIIGPMVGAVIEPELFTVSTEQQSALRQFGNGYFTFLAHRAEYRSSQKDVRGYPVLSYWYDLITAAQYLPYYKTDDWLRQHLNTHYSSGRTRERVRGELKRFQEGINTRYRTIFQDPERLYTLATRPLEQEPSLQDLPPFILENWLSPEMLIAERLQTYATNEDTKANPVAAIILNTPEMLGTQAVREIAHGSETTRQQFKMSYLFLTQLPRAEIQQQLGIELDPTGIQGTSPRFLRQRARVETSIRGDLPDVARVTDEAPLTEEFEFLRHYFRDYFTRNTEQLEGIQRLNDQLWHEVLDHPMWFISPRGDRYSIANNPHLSQFAINSLQIEYTPDYPRDYEVTLQFRDYANPLSFWLDTSRNLLDRQRKPLTIVPEQRTAFLAFVLPHIYAITSGILVGSDEKGKHGENDIETESDNEENREAIYRRAHYRTMQSTPERPITMQSRKARLHARLIRSLYGYDIYEEMKRRREIGTLQPDQFLTYVKAVDPKDIEASPEPVELTYPQQLLDETN